MPQAVGLLGAVVGAAMMTSETLAVVGFIVSLASSIVASAWQRHEAKKDLEDESPAGTRANTRSTQAFLGICYGETRIGGNDVFIDTRGGGNYHLWVVQVLSEGECEGLSAVYLADKMLYPTNEGWSTYATHEFYSGTADQEVDSDLQDAMGGDPKIWTDRLPYVCYVVWKFIYNEDLFSGLPERSVVLKGIKCYDFRTGETTWTNNPVLHLYDYLTNTRYGLGISDQLFNISTWETCANYVEEKGWSYNRMITSDIHAQDVINDILKHFRGTMLEYDGMLYLYHTDTWTGFANGLYAQSVALSLDDNDILVNSEGKANISVQRPSRFNKPTGSRVKFIEPGDENDYVFDSIMIGKDEGGEVTDLTLEGCNNREMAGELGTYFLEREQESTIITGVFRDIAIQLEPHDLVSLTSTALSFVNEEVRVTSVNRQNDGTVQLQFLREHDYFYNQTYDAKDFVAFNCTLPDRNAKTHVRVVSTASDPNPVEEVYYYRNRRFTRLSFELTLPTDTPFFDYAQVWISLDDGVNYDHLFNVTSDFYIDPIEEGKKYYIKIVAVTKFNVVEDWSTAELVTHNVIGYTDYPASLTYLNATVNSNSVSLYSNKVNDSDVELYEFRLGASWYSGIFLGALRSPNLNLVGVKPGQHTFIANTYSNNGIYGQTPRWATATLIDPPDGWEHETEESWMDNYDDFTESSAEFYNMEVHSGGAQDGWLECSHSQMTYEYLDFLDELLCVFPCNENSGTTIDSYNSSHQLDIDTATWASGEGYSDDCIYFVGSGFLSYDGDSNDEFDCPNMTFCSWVKHPAGYPGWTMSAQRGLAYREGKFSIYTKLEGIKNSPEFKLYAEITAGGTTDTLTSTIAIDADTYKHIAVTYDGTYIRFYIDGILTDSVEHAAGGNMDDSKSDTTYFGYDGTNSFYGWMDEIVFDDVALPYERIEALANMSVYQGVYLSPVFSKPLSVGRHLIYTEGDTIVTGTGTNWLSKFTAATTGRQGGMATKSWLEIFEMSEGSKVQIKAYCGDDYDSSWPSGTTEVPMMEILTGIVEAKYFQVEIKIEDPGDAVNALVEPYYLHICEEA